MAMATVFVTRRTDNKSLARATPQQLARAKSRAYDVVPPLGVGYQRVKRVVLDGAAPPAGPLVELAGATFDAAHAANATANATGRYLIDPYVDFNGASLLYFASYPRIADVCERVVFNARLARAGREGAAAEAAFVFSPVARDVHYFGNADAGDVLTFTLRSVGAVEKGRIAIWSTLARAKDGARIADVFTVKESAEDAALAVAG
jgi:probable biosynthetic protein (TIGR04098 family)